MADLFGYEAQRAAFKDIPRQRDHVAEEKAMLCDELRRLCRKPPPSIMGADIIKTRYWVTACKAARVVMADKRSSVPALLKQISVMRSYE